MATLVVLATLLGLVFPLTNLLVVLPLFDIYLRGRVDPETLLTAQRLVVHPNLTFAVVGFCLVALVMWFFIRSRRADWDLMFSEERLKHILDSNPAGILIVDRQTERVVAANPAAGAMIGIDPSKLPGMFIRCLFECPDSPSAAPARDLMRDASGECRLLTSRNGTLPIWGSAGDLQFGETRQRIISFVDLSALKQAEKAVIRAERLAAVGTLTAGIAHEFNNTHQIALGFSELALRSAELDPGLQKILESIHGALGRARNISRQLLVFSGAQTSKEREGHLAEVLQGVLSLTRRELESTGVRLETDLAAVPPVVMDSGQIGQVALNLLINAQHALQDQPVQVITVRTGFDEEGAFFAVADTGCGIPPGAETRIFSPFYSTKGEFAEKNSPQAKVKGTGLGLSVSHAIVENHGGSIQVSRNPGGGTTFTVRLPLARTADTPAPALEPPREETVFHRSRGTGTILVLDDEAEVREVLRHFLVVKGFRVLDTAHGSEALDWSRNESIDLVLVDLQMPGMNGFQFLHRLGELPAEHRPAALVLTGTLGAESILEKEGLGWAGVIQKPFRLEEIDERLQAVLAARPASPSWVLPGSVRGTVRPPAEN